MNLDPMHRPAPFEQAGAGIIRPASERATRVSSDRSLGSDEARAEPLAALAEPLAALNDRSKREAASRRDGR